MDRKNSCKEILKTEIKYIVNIIQYTKISRVYYSILMFI